jgi:putative protease
MTLYIRPQEIELLAPAGDWECMRAAVANGADAVFFGIEKFNARARAHNFKIHELPDIMAFLHLYGVKGFVTFNILVFEVELEDARQLVNACINAGVDAVIVQDWGLVQLIREISPDFPIHGSTQMTITSPEAVEFTKPYGLERVVLGRENNLKQIKQIGDQAKLPMEVFVHGALCVSYSGQCLTSEIWGGRSANRGECAQACRLPYDLMVDDQHKPMGNVAYLLSPKDLAAVDLVPELIEAGVTSFKIEGRLKSPEYVANVVSKYRQAIDRYMQGIHEPPTVQEMRELEQSFSRGFTHGFLTGTNNKQLVEGTYPKSRGVYIGKVKEILREGVLCELQAPVKRGDGIVFDAGDPTQKEEGGRIYDLRRNDIPLQGLIESGTIEIVAGRKDVDLKKVHVGDRIWKTNDPHLDIRLRQTYQTTKPYRTFPVDVLVKGTEGQTLQTHWVDRLTGHVAYIESEQLLQKAIKRPMDALLFIEQFGRLGGTIYELAQLEVEIVGEVILPMSELNQIRRKAVEFLEAKRITPQVYQVYPSIESKENKHNSQQLADGARADASSHFNTLQNHETKQDVHLIALCRTLEQVHAVLETDVKIIYADFEFIKQYPAAVQAVHAAGRKIGLATPRIHMPGETGYFQHILQLQPDYVLVRNIGAVHYFTTLMREAYPASLPVFIGDFSLNIANHKSVELFLRQGLAALTPSYDLNIQQMVDLLKQSHTSRLEIVIHQHMPMFHTEHCVYCTFLSEGTDYTNCGRPCEEHRVSLQDRIGISHPVRVDDGCRNTVFNAIDQSGAEYLNTFISLGVKSFRIEFLEERPDKVHQVIDLYQKAIAGQISGTQVWKSLKATNQLGVTRGQLVK